MLERIRDQVGRFFAARRVSPERQPEIRLITFGDTTMAVPLARPEEALKVSTAWRCVSLISQSIAMLPWNVMRREAGTGNSAREFDHPVDFLLSSRPNDEMTAFSFRQTMVSHILLYGNAYAEIERDVSGRPMALWPIAPDRVEPYRLETGELIYRVMQPTGGIAALSKADIWHVPGLAWDGIRGYSVLEVGASAVSAALGMDRFAGAYFAQGMRPSGVIQSPNKMSPEALKNLKETMAESHGGWRNAHKPLILDAGMAWQQVSDTPENAQFIDTRKFTVVDICRWFGVPPYLAFHADSEPRANVETQSREFLMYGLMPRIAPMEQETDRKLFVVPRRYYSKMNVNSFQRGDAQARGEYYKMMRDIGAFSVNDVLRAEDMDTIGPEGDVRTMQMQYVPIEEIGEEDEPEPENETEPEASSDQQDEGDDDADPV